MIRHIQPWNITLLADGALHATWHLQIAVAKSECMI